MTTTAQEPVVAPPDSNAKMPPHVRKLRDAYAIKPGAPFYQREFGYYCIDRWREQGLPEHVDFRGYFGYDPDANAKLWGLGWCEADFVPSFEEKLIEDRGEHEVVQDFAGRHVLYFKGRRSGFMPEYLVHPVKDQRSWEENCLWRLDPSSPDRIARRHHDGRREREYAVDGRMVTQCVIGGYMYLRSLIGPVDLLYKICEDPDLIHTCMRRWLELSDAGMAIHQQYVTLDEIFFGEDICFNNGSLISPDMMKEFLFPYYQQLVANARARQLDKSRHLFVQVDTDGWCDPVIPLYRGSIGMDVMSPFEVASGCDVVRTGREYPDLVISGGIDKRILAEGPEAIDREIDRIFPVMFKRGGYIPTCDHGVPEEVSLENYLHYRKRCREYA